MAEIILPPEENEETPQAPELNIDKPTENSKVITIEFEAKKTNKVSTKDTNQQLYTTDTDAWFEFKETSLGGANGTYSVVFRNRHDGSIFQRTGDVVGSVAYYKIPHQEIRHAGAWRGQVVYTLSNGDTTAREFDYDVQGHILDGKDVREIVVEDFETLMSQLRSMKDSAEQELAGLTQELENTTDTAEQNETNRQAFFDDLVEDIDGLQANYQELLDTGVLQTNINTKLEALEEEYAPKLTEVTAQLAQTSNKVESLTNAKSRLKVLNPYGNYQNIHPKVLYFENGWNGYNYWMAYTPYPHGKVSEENPCLAVSNNGFDWGVPTGFANEVLDEWGGDTSVYNNDTHMVYRDDLDRLEIWWRKAYSSDMELRRRTSTDGVTWTPTEVMFTGLRSGNDHISPAIIFEDGLYKMLSVNTESTRTLNYSESLDGKNWGVRTRVSADWGTLTPWHLDFIKKDGQYEMIIQAWDKGETSNTSSLYFMKSNDLINWGKPDKIIQPSIIPGKFDDQGIYRSSLVFVDDRYHLYYSAVSTTNERGMGLSIGKTMKSLKGIDEDSRVYVQDGSYGGAFAANKEATNIVGVMQKNYPERHGGIKVGNLLFADGTEEGVAPTAGSVRFNPARNLHETYDTTIDTWIPFKGRSAILLEKTTEQALETGVPSIVNLERKVRDIGNDFTGGNTFTAPTYGDYRFSVGIQLQNLNDGDTVEVYLERGNSPFFLCRNIVRGNVHQVNGSMILNVNKGITVQLKVLITSTSTNPLITRYDRFTYMQIETL